MPEPNRRLGRGLSSLIDSPSSSRLSDRLSPGAPSAPSPASAGGRHASAQTVRLDSVIPNPDQPRRTISPDKLRPLVESIQRNGLIQPIVVRPIPVVPIGNEPGVCSSQLSVKYGLIAGERRWRAAKEAGLTEVPAIIREADGQQLLELALVENLQREDLNAIDRAEAYRQLQTRFSLTPEDIGRRMGEDRTTVTNYLRLLELDAAVRDLVAAGLVSMGHARALLGVRDGNLQRKLAEDVVRAGLSVRAIEDAVRRQKRKPEPPPGKDRTGQSRPHIRDLEQQFRRALQMKVTIREGRRKNSGRVIIEYNSLDDFDRLCEALGVES